MKAGIDRVLIQKIEEPKTEKKDLSFLEKDVQVEKAEVIDVFDESENELGIVAGDIVFYVKGTDLKINSELYAIKIENILCYEEGK